MSLYGKLHKRKSAADVDTLLKTFVKTREKGAKVLTHPSFETLFQVAAKRKEFLERAATPPSEAEWKAADYFALQAWAMNPFHQAEALRFGFEINGRKKKDYLYRARFVLDLNDTIQQQIVQILFSAYDSSENEIEVSEIFQLIVILYPHEHFGSETMGFLTDVHLAENLRV